MADRDASEKSGLSERRLTHVSLTMGAPRAERGDVGMKDGEVAG